MHNFFGIFLRGILCADIAIERASLPSINLCYIACYHCCCFFILNTFCRLSSINSFMCMEPCLLWSLEDMANSIVFSCFSFVYLISVRVSSVDICFPWECIFCMLIHWKMCRWKCVWFWYIFCLVTRTYEPQEICVRRNIYSIHFAVFGVVIVHGIIKSQLFSISNSNFHLLNL